MENRWQGSVVLKLKVANSVARKLETHSFEDSREELGYYVMYKGRDMPNGFEVPESEEERQQRKAEE